MSTEHRVIGPPGTGKTTYLSRQCVTAAQKYGGSSVVIASLTRAAAREIASRTTGVPQENIGTLHAHAYRRLNRPDIAETSEGVKDWNERTNAAAWRLSKRSVANPESADATDSLTQADDTGDALLAEIGVYRARCVDQRLWPPRLLGFWASWSAWKESTGRVDFTDLIVRAISEVDSLDAAVVMLDEAQDMSSLEMQLARKWGAECQQLVVCGDPDQNLYEWRGSDPQVFYSGEAASHRVLSQSYRVPVRVHSLAMEWVDQIRDREHADYYPTEVEGLVQRHTGLCYADGGPLARLVGDLSRDGSSVMVLGSCDYMLQDVIGALRDRAIPFWNPYRRRNGRWNPIHADRLLAFVRWRKEAWGDEARMWTWEDVQKWTEKLIAKEVLTHGSKNWIQSKAMPRSKFDDSPEQMANLDDLLRRFHPEHRSPILDGDLDWWIQHLHPKTRKQQEYVYRIASRRGPGLLRQRPQIIVGTIHSVKGGEADKVVLCPDLSTAGMNDWQGKARNGIVRMFYVGMTRARKELHVLGSKTPSHVEL